MSDRLAFVQFEWKYQLFKYKNGGVRSKNFLLELLKWSCPTLCRNIFLGNRCKSVSETSHHRCLTWSFLLNLSENISFSNVTVRECELKIFCLIYWIDLVLDLVQTNFLEVGAYGSLKPATAGVWQSRFCWIWVKISLFFKYKDRWVGCENFQA